MMAASTPNISRTPMITEAAVVSNPRICSQHYRLTLRLGDFPRAEPGQFVHLIDNTSPAPTAAPGIQDDRRLTFDNGRTGTDMVIRRAFSIAGLRRDDDGTQIDVIYRVVGTATGWMSRLKAGERVNLLGPIGNDFTIAADKRLALLVSGGVGLPPMIWWAQKLAEENIETVAFVGAQSKSLVALNLEIDSPPDTSAGEAVFGASEFTQHGVKIVLSTDDGSLGFCGFVTDALQRYIERRRPDPSTTMVYTCGPELMMKAAVRLCERWTMDCQLCMERSMACGMGTCQSCIVPVHEPAAADGWRYKLCCTDGPIFDRREVIWD